MRVRRISCALFVSAGCFFMTAGIWAGDASREGSVLLQALSSNENELEIDLSRSRSGDAINATPAISNNHSSFRNLLPVQLVQDQSFEPNPGTAFARFIDQLDQGAWIVGAEAVFMDVDADSDGLITLSFDDSRTGGTDFRGQSGKGLNGPDVAPRIWAGRQLTPAWAVLVRYWELSDAETTSPATPAGQVNLPNFATIQEFQSLSMSTFDIEAVRSFNVYGLKFDAALGGRHATLNYRNSVESFGVFTTGNFVNLDLSNGGSFEGDGLTYGLTARKQVFDLPAWVFVSGRGSALIGTTDNFARSNGTIVSNPSTPLSGAATVRRNNADAHATIGEFQAGLQVEHALAAMPAVAFFRAAFEYQYWNVDGKPLGGAGFGGTIGDLTTNSFSSNRGDPSVTLMGLALSTGLTW